ncbi:MAG: ABC transporter permease [Gemmatimonadota bacterium]|jgi:cell division transport system permease protein|nr:MAG: ABC transporter permease [Gemmatimonadota bacterium]
MRPFREALVSLIRRPVLATLSVTAIGLSLFIVGLFGLTAHNISRALASVEEKVEIVAYLTDEIGEDQLRLVRTEIGAYPEVASVEYVSKTEALYNASRELTEFSDVFPDLEINPLPASLEIRLRPGHRTPGAVQEVAARLGSYEFVDDVRFGREWVDRIHTLRRIAGGTALVLGGSFAIVAMLLVGTTVRMSIHARSTEIAIMENVGATSGFIQRPFLVEGLISGVLGGLLAWALTYVAYRLLDRAVFAVLWLPDPWILAGILAGGILGMVAAQRSVRRELRNLYAI